MSSVSSATSSVSSAATSSSSATDVSSTTSGATFVGNMPSTVLFFLAMAVGVSIALVFTFFTARYFIRGKYGLHLHSSTSRGVMFLPRAGSPHVLVPYTDREIQQHLEYLRNHHLLRDDFLERRILSSRGRRRRRRRGRFAKMKKLTPEEVQELFPKCIYADWLGTGDDATSVSSPDFTEASSAMPAAAKAVSITEEEDAGPDPVVVELAPPAPHELDSSSLNALLKGKTELHFDSGSCSICLEVYELDDVVRGLICGHVYHADCVDPWLTRRRACCPICKRDYYKEEGATTGTGPATIEEEGLSGTGEAGPGEDNANGGDHAHAQPQNTQPQNTQNTQPQNTQNDDDTNPLRDLDLDVIRTDPNIQALFNELVPLSERVRVLLDEFPELDMEARAKRVAKKRYGNVFKVFFWKLMGISKRDLYNWAVIKIYQEERASLDTANTNSDRPQDGPRPPTTGVQAPGPGAGAEGSTPELASGDAVEMRELRPQDASSTHENREALEDAAARRESVEDRV
ncbi:hypothetical protein METBIDRAFT_41364 [Metschnikowia bicuspidata var. bicuspidata NRRL YB-4993]|uniref:RING-type domain-containing protein n=1 Tax=Metschnikowia bicuspidata var. bicuspidata NRRL YB-4993 TaxID=869754 RepID=A0A1A0HAW9_9ASCO|nr:hypothetical protein METBIDRAFT_41364 [Metschnikowia bicuspidata var. bicuspidata NRRL YB-4993]OBA21269.1 hypothetical protein METBIDRAFT_41364 [Metschnikowia bicuspidata var. bicuspidata NRRL YB-4993]